MFIRYLLIVNSQKYFISLFVLYQTLGLSSFWVTFHPPKLSIKLENFGRRSSDVSLDLVETRGWLD